MSAQLVVCSCGKHAHIRLGSGFRGNEFCFKQHGLGMVRNGIKLETLSEAEAAKLTTAILACPLPVEPDAVELRLIWNAELFTHLFLDPQIRNLSEKEVCDFINGDSVQPAPPDLLAALQRLLDRAKVH